jgi:hypothetical protein
VQTGGVLSLISEEMELTWGKKGQLDAIVFSSLPAYSFLTFFAEKII